MPDDRTRDEQREKTRENGPDATGSVATAVRELIGGVRPGTPLRAGGLTLVPLLPATERVTRRTGYLPLEEALRRNVVAITEQARESVPELLATSTADMPVVLVGGEQVVGGLQNRVLNTTILVAAHAKLPIPVTCVEAGRWHETYDEMADLPVDAESGDTPSTAASAAAPDAAEPARTRGLLGRFAQAGPVQPSQAQAGHMKRTFASDEAAYASLRKSHAKYVTHSLSAGRGHHSDQGAVWGEVAMRMASVHSYSPSGAMHALYKTPERARKLRETVEALKRPAGTLGFVAVLGSEVLGAEVFADEALADAYWNKLARSYAVEALDAEARDGTPLSDPSASDEPASDASSAVSSAQAPETPGGETRLLEEALAADIQIHPSPGLGTDARLVGKRISGAGLVYDGAVVHLSLFPEETAEDIAKDAGDQHSDDEESAHAGALRRTGPRAYGGHRQTRTM